MAAPEGSGPAGDRPVAVVTGATRGIGREVVAQLAARGHIVVLGARDERRGSEVARHLDPDATTVHSCRLDVTDPASARRAASWIQDTFGRADVLVNNAGIDYDTDQDAVGADLFRVRAALETNLFGAWQVTQALLPLLRGSPHPRIVNVSSEVGSISGMVGGTPGYSVSKAALNALTRLFADELAGDRVLVNAVSPGLTATDMGRGGGRSIAEGAAGIVWAAVLPDDGPSGGFYHDGRPLAW
ncbi:short-chain dehydrogenase [Pseudonocardia sulfidoxydans NBRC 16205]|uniref:Short-chain dehydrogenase n=1 Tax=Pseudonocardia sulfidoxydans NBRC 16205 TaxID=1223511 RepID=A0A511DNI1_9PSEU|nr:short-chain dehydrogenase [Pseudonocardia sulfidoxydans NBRC 16205]